MRGAFIVVVAYIGFEVLVSQKDHPHWVRHARTMQLVGPAAEILIANLPEDYAIKRRKDPGARKKPGAPKDAGSVVRGLITPTPKASNKKANDGYGVRERQDMERLIGNTQQQ